MYVSFHVFAGSGWSVCNAWCVCEAWCANLDSHTPNDWLAYFTCRSPTGHLTASSPLTGGSGLTELWDQRLRVRSSIIPDHVWRLKAAAHFWCSLSPHVSMESRLGLISFFECRSQRVYCFTSREGREIWVVTDTDQDQVIPCFFVNGTVKAHALTNMQASSHAHLHLYKTDVNRGGAITWRNETLIDLHKHKFAT